MRKDNNMKIARNKNQLGNILKLEPESLIEIDLRSRLNKKIIEIVRNQQLTHIQVSKMARTSRTRVTALLNGNTQSVSTDLMLRILYSLGYTAKVSFQPINKVA